MWMGEQTRAIFNECFARFFSSSWCSFLLLESSSRRLEHEWSNSQWLKLFKKVSFIHSFLVLKPLVLLLISKKKFGFLRFIGYLYSGMADAAGFSFICHFREKMLYSIQEKIWLIFWNNLFSRSKLRKKNPSKNVTVAFWNEE